ncbi:MAG: anaerobic ribonucleoside-triphosphate reductase activating protein [Clostridia bacterium]
MRIAGYNPNSYVDYPANISAVIFLGGCNFNCFYCHNRELITAIGGIPLEEVIAKIAKRALFLDAVVITGGEPTLHPIGELSDLINSIKDLGLKVKLDTNGTRPKVLQQLSVDYIAMDIKAPLEKYADVTSLEGSDLANIKESIEFIKTQGGEFRTTVYPELNTVDIIQIAKSIAGGKAVYYLQKMLPTDYMTDKREVSQDFLSAAQAEANKYIPTFLRGV